MAFKRFVLNKAKVKISFFIEIFFIRKKHFLTLKRKLEILTLGKDDIYHCIYGKIWIIDAYE